MHKTGKLNKGDDPIFFLKYLLSEIIIRDSKEKLQCNLTNNKNLGIRSTKYLYLVTGLKDIFLKSCSNLQQRELRPRSCIKHQFQFRFSSLPVRSSKYSPM